MTTQHKDPRAVIEQLVEALEVLNNLDADINFLNTNKLEEMVDAAITAGREALEAKESCIMPHTAAGFRAAFESEHKRKPTEQEIWNHAIPFVARLNPQARKPVGINGLTEAETSASMSVRGLSVPTVGLQSVHDAITNDPSLCEPAPQRPPNCGTGHCSCIECVMEPAPSTPLSRFVNSSPLEREAIGNAAAAEADAEIAKMTAPSTSGEREGCDMCLDPDGVPCFPEYGIGPHTCFYKIHGAVIGQSQPLPKDQWPSNYQEDPECPGMGVYWCAHCGQGKPAAHPAQGEPTHQGKNHEQQIRSEMGAVGGQQSLESASSGGNSNPTVLVSRIEALLALDAAGVLVPHGIGGHARSLLKSAAALLQPTPDARPVGELTDAAIHNIKDTCTSNAVYFRGKWLDHLKFARTILAAARTQPKRDRQ